MSIYVEILVRAPMDALWTHTQTPTLHEKWDLRFSRIDYLPRASRDDPQRFRYSTRIGFGLEVKGEGETVGHRDSADGSRSSALKFGSAAFLSIIREGSGYWKYIPTEDGVRFLTWYDYRTRFGVVGALLDRLVFRPLLGWATAWSFDRLRLWLEEGIEPAQAMRQTLVHLVTHLGLAIILALAIATVIVDAYSRRRFEAAFDSFALNVAVACLVAIDLLVLSGLPSAARCRRRPPTEPT